MQTVYIITDKKGGIFAAFSNRAEAEKYYEWLGDNELFIQEFVVHDKFTS